ERLVARVGDVGVDRVDAGVAEGGGVDSGGDVDAAVVGRGRDHARGDVSHEWYLSGCGGAASSPAAPPGRGSRSWAFAPRCRGRALIYVTTGQPYEPCQCSARRPASARWWAAAQARRGRGGAGTRLGPCRAQSRPRPPSTVLSRW